MNERLKSLFTSTPQTKNAMFNEEVLNKNYNQAYFLSKLLVGISALMYAISIIVNDLDKIKLINLLYFVMSFIVLALFVILKLKHINSSKVKTMLVYVLIVINLTWSSSLVGFAPNRYEMIGTYSLFILSLSSLFLLKWNINLFLQLFSIIYVLIILFLFGDFFFIAPIIPKVSIVVSLIVFSWFISRLLYFRYLENFELNSLLIQQNQEIQLEVEIQTKKLLEQTNNQTKSIVLSMNILLDQYTPYTKGHCEKVAQLSKKVAQSLLMDMNDVETLYWAAVSHDIGKILVPLEILNKPSSLTESEYEIIKKHPTSAYNALVLNDTLHDLAYNVLCHHERWDGLGYPSGLSQDDIPLASQIISVCDAWDAMTSNRPYRTKLTNEVALTIIKENRGVQFSPKVVDCFIRLYENNSNWF